MPNDGEGRGLRGGRLARKWHAPASTLRKFRGPQSVRAQYRASLTDRVLAELPRARAGALAERMLRECPPPRIRPFGH
jgi:hypothetical protein